MKPHKNKRPKGGEIYTKTHNKMYNEDIAVLWEENYIKLDSLTHNHTQINPKRRV